MNRMTIIAVLVAILCTNLVSSRSVNAEEPKKIRVTGVMLPFEEGKREDLAVATIFVHDKPWFLRVGKVEGLTPEERGTAVNDGELMAEMRFSGPDALMRRMQKADVTGKPLIIRRVSERQRKAISSHFCGGSAKIRQGR